MSREVFRTESPFKMEVKKYLIKIGAYCECAIIGSTSGIPDLYGHYKGRFFAIETKRSGGTKNGKSKEPLQNYKIKKIMEAGGIAFVLEDTPDWKEKINDKIIKICLQK